MGNPFAQFDDFFIRSPSIFPQIQLGRSTGFFMALSSPEGSEWVKEAGQGYFKEHIIPGMYDWVEVTLRYSDGEYLKAGDVEGTLIDKGLRVSTFWSQDADYVELLNTQVMDRGTKIKTCQRFYKEYEVYTTDILLLKSMCSLVNSLFSLHPKIIPDIEVFLKEKGRIPFSHNLKQSWKNLTQNRKLPKKRRDYFCEVLNLGNTKNTSTLCYGGYLMLDDVSSVQESVSAVAGVSLIVAKLLKDMDNVRVRMLYRELSQELSLSALTASNLVASKDNPMAFISAKTKDFELGDNCFGEATSSSSPLAPLASDKLEVPQSNFDFGRKSLWEGVVRLFFVFFVSGTLLFVFSLVSMRGFQLRSRFRKYFAVFEFDGASGICIGTPVKIRGVSIGKVVHLNLSLRSIEAVVEVEDKILIPTNSLIQVNQTGLHMKASIDITPREPIPTPSFGPLDAGCVIERLIVCDRQKIKGNQGVSFDETVGMFTRVGRAIEAIGVADIYSLAERVACVIEEARPLLIKINGMVDDIEPMVSEAHDSGLLKEVTKCLTRASEDLSRLHSSIMAPENAESVQKSMNTLIFTLKNIENISSDILGFTADEATWKNLKLLIKSLSRLI